MLLGKDGCRTKKCNLFLLTDRFEGSSKRNFCFTKTNIPTQETIHRFCLHHIAFHIFNRYRLVACKWVFKFCFKLFLHAGVFTKLIRDFMFTFTVKIDQTLRNVFDTLFDLCLGLLPIIGSKRVQFRDDAFSGYELTYQLELFQRDIQTAVITINDV